MKTKLVILASLLAGAGLVLAAGDAATTPAPKSPATLPAPVLQLPPNEHPLFESGPITGKYWTLDGKRLGERSAYVVQQTLNNARVDYLANRPKEAVAEMVKAALSLEEDAQLAKGKTRVELSGSAIALQRDAVRIADGHPLRMNQMFAVFHEAHQAAADFDGAHFGGV